MRPCTLAKYNGNTTILVSDLFKVKCMVQNNYKGKNYFEKYTDGMGIVLDTNIWVCDYIKSVFNN